MDEKKLIDDSHVAVSTGPAVSVSGAIAGVTKWSELTGVNPWADGPIGPHEAAWRRINAMCELSPENLPKGGIDRASAPYWRTSAPSSE